MPHFTVLPYSCLSSLLHTDFKSRLSNTVNAEINRGKLTSVQCCAVHCRDEAELCLSIMSSTHPAFS